eukprot:TRINITY_DN1222_c0_g2_i1.p1 TRINITY_DN1222_c0_g2~~TRINITY_DN1222_c0_g2_i1.p1  ORF type:complete len:147 (+),score=35.32 TRINITY_DN1222_c0_g2_i1:256-696(+)
MDQPLFGEEKKKNKYLKYGVYFILTAFVLETVIVAVLKGLDKNGHWYHIFLAALVLIELAAFGILIRWYNRGDLDPKFKQMIVLLGFLVFITCLSAQFYVFEPPPPGSACAGLYSNALSKCYPTCPNNFCLSFRTGSCFNCTEIAQ